MGKNVYVTPRDRDKWHNEQNTRKKTANAPSAQDTAARVQRLAEKYKQQKRQKTDEPQQ